MYTNKMNIENKITRNSRFLSEIVYLSGLKEGIYVNIIDLLRKSFR